MLPKRLHILAIDDDAGDAELLRRHLAAIGEIEIDFSHCDDPLVGIRELKDRPVDLVFLDYRLGAETGLSLLHSIRERGDQRPIIILTGQGDETLAVQLMRSGADDYLVKSELEPSTLRRAMQHAYTCYLGRKSEKDKHELLSKTMAATVRVLVELLSNLNPLAHQRASRVQSLVQRLAQAMHAGDAWEIELAASLSQIGCLYVPVPILQKWEQGVELSPLEARIFRQHSRHASDLIDMIPRLHNVAEIVAYQAKHFDGSGFPDDTIRGEQIPRGARVLNLALDFDQLVQRGASPREAIAALGGQSHRYDPDVLGALKTLVTSAPVAAVAM